MVFASNVLPHADRWKIERCTACGPCAAVLRSYAANLEERLARYRGDIHRELINLGRTQRERFLWKAILENGIATYEAELAWTNDTLKGLEAFAE